MDNIVLCGFMGCGKSSVGKLLAKRLRFEFLDTDELCEQREGMSITEMFDRLGETGFRDAEHSACTEAARSTRTVIATGGGALTFERNVELFESDTIVFLDASLEEIQRRIGGKDGRPLFKDADKAKALFLSRLDCYKAAADITVAADGAADEVAANIIRSIGGIK